MNYGSVKLPGSNALRIRRKPVLYYNPIRVI